METMPLTSTYLTDSPKPQYHNIPKRLKNLQRKLCDKPKVLSNLSIDSTSRPKKIMKMKWKKGTTIDLRRTPPSGPGKAQYADPTTLGTYKQSCTIATPFVDKVIRRDSKHQETPQPNSQDKSKPKPGQKVSYPIDLTTIKKETLWPEARKQILLLVTASNEPNKAPIAINLLKCNSSDQFFGKLIHERRLHTVEKQVNMISTTLWNGKKLALRKGESDDWELFMDRISRAWNTVPQKVEDDYEIEVTIHVDE